MSEISYKIDKHPRNAKRSVLLYLWREEDGKAECIAKFFGHDAVRAFIKEFDFPVTEQIKSILYADGVHQGGRGFV